LPGRIRALPAGDNPSEGRVPSFQSAPFFARPVGWNVESTVADRPFSRIHQVNMPNLRQTLFVLIMSVLVLLGFSGCSIPQQDSSIPWSRPADWEGQIPGMGTGR
jgi:hypothetical protein